MSRVECLDRIIADIQQRLKASDMSPSTFDAESVQLWGTLTHALSALGKIKLLYQNGQISPMESDPT